MNLQNLNINIDLDIDDCDYIFESAVNRAEHDFYQYNWKPYMADDHISVLLQESISALNIQDGKTYLDCTFGAGGHSRAILQSANCRLIAIDRDPHVKMYADYLAQEFGDRFTFLQGKFSEAKALLANIGVEKVDGILMDLGVSSMQIDTPRRGFSFQQDGALDMRMGEDELSAEELVNELPEEELAGIIFKYGDERQSRRIAKAIVAERAQKRITRTLELANIVRKAIPFYNDGIHPATRTFQAIRIWVNQEMEEIESALNNSVDLLNPAGRLAVITFHSGEDAIVKAFINEKSGKEESVSRYQPFMMSAASKKIIFNNLTRKVIAPSEEEVIRNPRSRSAKLRVAERVG
jgi:16S rRNA (cytosine1402-N4)-methyltransferase